MDPSSSSSSSSRAPPMLKDSKNLDANSSTSKHHESNDYRSTYAQSHNCGYVNNNINGGNSETIYILNKIFVGGLPFDVTMKEFDSFFAHFGTVTNAILIYDHTREVPRGFGLIVFGTKETVERVLQRQFYNLKDKTVEVKRAFRKAYNNNNSRKNTNCNRFDGPSGRVRGDASPRCQYGVPTMNSFSYPGYAYGAGFQSTQILYWIYDPTYLYYFGYYQECLNNWMKAHSLQHNLSPLYANGIKTWGDVS